MEINKEAILYKLSNIPDKLFQVEEEYRKAINKLNEEKLKLLEKECELINAGKVKGRNGETRQAEMWPETKELHKAILRAEIEVDKAKIEYNYWKTTNENLQLITKLID